MNHFEPFVNDIGLTEDEMALYVEQVKVGCTKAMLQCLDPVDRFVYIVGKLFGISGELGSEICRMSAPAYRQRLSRASRRIAGFMTGNCGLVSESATCRCRKRIGVALERHRIDPEARRTESATIRDYLDGMKRLDGVAEAFRDNPFIDASASLTGEVLEAVLSLANSAT